MTMTTKGISPKIWPPLQLALGGVIADWAADGNISRGAIAAVLVASVAVMFAWLAPPGEVDSPPPVYTVRNTGVAPVYVAQSGVGLADQSARAAADASMNAAALPTDEQEDARPPNDDARLTPDDPDAP